MKVQASVKHRKIMDLYSIGEHILSHFQVGVKRKLHEQNFLPHNVNVLEVT